MGIKLFEDNDDVWIREQDFVHQRKIKGSIYKGTNGDYMYNVVDSNNNVTPIKASLVYEKEYGARTRYDNSLKKHGIEARRHEHRNREIGGEVRKRQLSLSLNLGSINAPFVPTSLDDTVLADTDPLKHMRGNTLARNLRQMGILIMDVETTGLQEKDRMFSAGLSSIDLNTGQPIAGLTEKEYYFPLGRQGGFKTAQTQEEFEEALRDAHSSAVFGEKQYNQGSLSKTAAAYARGFERPIDPNYVYGYGDDGVGPPKPLKMNDAEYKYTTQKEYLRALDRDIAAQPNGAVLLTHNSNFESNQWAKLRSSKYASSAFREAYDTVASRTVHNTKLVGNGDDLQFKSSNDNPTPIKRMYEALNELNEQRTYGSKVDVQKALLKYVDANVEVINLLNNQVHQVHGVKGRYVGIDSMHIHRALMAFGALHGDVDLHNLRLGNSVEAQMRAWLGMSVEAHESLDDSRVQSRIFGMMIDELEKYSTIPNYRSAMMQQMNTYLNDNNVAYETFKRNILNEIGNLDKEKGFEFHEYQKQRASYAARIYEYMSKKDKELKRSSDPSAEQQRKFLHYTKTIFSEQVEDKKNNHTAKSIAKKMEEIFAGTAVDEEVSKVKLPTGDYVDRAKNFVKKHPYMVAGAAALAGASLFLGGETNKEPVKYNTYDELYGQYYGVGFADWQNANNAHKILY